MDKLAGAFSFKKFVQEKLAEDLKNVPKSPKTGTVVFAIKYLDGILVSGDKMISYSGGKIYGEPYVKIRQISPFSVLAFAGNVYAIQSILEIYKKLLEIFTLRTASSPSIDNQVRIFRNLQQSLNPFFASLASFIFAGIEPTSERRVIVDFSGCCYFPKSKFAVAGCGEDEAETVVKSFISPQTKEITLKEALSITFHIHRQAAERNSGISHPYLVPPDIVLIDKEGLKVLYPEKIEEILRNDERNEKIEKVAKKARKTKKGGKNDQKS